MSYVRRIFCHEGKHYYATYENIGAGHYGCVIYPASTKGIVTKLTPIWSKVTSTFDDITLSGCINEFITSEVEA